MAKKNNNITDNSYLYLTKTHKDLNDVYGDYKLNPWSSKVRDLHDKKKISGTDTTRKELNDKINQVNEKFEEISKQIIALEKTTSDNIEKKLSTVKEQIEDSRSRVVETLALFVGIFTFLSLQVQIINAQTDIDKVIGLTLISGGMITFFVLVLDVMINSGKSDSTRAQVRFSLMLMVCLLLIAYGVLSLQLK